MGGVTAGRPPAGRGGAVLCARVVRTFLVAGVAATVALGLLPPAGAVTSIPEPPCSDGGCFDITNAMSVDRHLSVDIGPRRVGTQGAVDARDYLKDAMTANGLSVTLQEFPLPAGGVFWNVVGQPAPGTMDAGPYLLVGGHFDTVAGSPGANDNATGTASVVEIARAIRAQPAALPVVFVAFGAEEVQPSASSGRVGSNYFVKHMTSAQKANLVAMINLDYIGYGAGTKVRLRHISGTPSEGTERLQGLAASIGISTEVLNINSSDDAPFALAGLDTGSLRGIDDPNYHTSGDTYARLGTAELAAAGRLAMAAVRSYTPPPPTPVWTRVQESAPAATYAGPGWATISTSNAYGGTYRRSRTAGDTVTFAFEGTGVRWIGLKKPAGGKVEVRLDGVLLATVDCYASSATWRKVLFERTGLVAGSHTLELKITGQKRSAASDRYGYVDAFEYLS